MVITRVAAVLLLWAEWMGPLRPVHHLRDPVAVGLGLGVGLGSLGLLLGWRTPWSALGTASLGFLLWFRVPELATLEAWLLLCTCALLATVPAGATLSLDAAAGRPSIDRGGQVLFRLLVSGFFVAAALHQLQPVFLDGTRLQQLLLARFGVWVGPPVVLQGIAITLLALELGLGAAPWSTRLRLPGAVVATSLFGVAYLALFTGTTSGVVALMSWAALTNPERARLSRRFHRVDPGPAVDRSPANARECLVEKEIRC